MNKDLYNLKQLESLCEHAPCGMGIFISMEESPIYLNPAYYNLVGYTKEEYEKEVANRGDKLLVPEDIHISDLNITKFNKKPQKLDSIYRIRQKSGEIKWIRLTVSPFNSGDKKYALCFFEDITGEKENLSMLKMISDNTGLSISVIKVKENSFAVIYANTKFFELIGISREDYIANPNQNINIGVSEEDKERTYLAMKESLSTGKEQNIEYLYKMENGKRIYLSRRLSAIKSFDGGVLLLSVTSDITKEKESQKKITEEHNRFQMVVHEMNIAVFEWNVSTGDFYSTGNYNDYAMADVDSNLLLHNQGPIDLIHPDDIPELMRYAKKAETDSLRVDARLRLRLKKGGYRWTHITAIKTLDENGNHIKTTGVVTDISKEKESELQIQSTVDNVPTGISIYQINNAKEISTYFHNETYYKMLGYTKKEYFEKTKGDFFKIIHPDDIITAQNGIFHYLPEKLSACIEIRLMCANGKYSWFKIDGKLIKKSDKTFTVYECFTNIDESIASRKKERNSIMKYAVDIFNYLYISDDIEKSVNIILQRIGESCHVSRAYIFEDDDNHTYCSNTFEWCADGVTPQKDNLNKVFYADIDRDYPDGDYRNFFNEYGVFDCSDINILPKSIVEIVTPQNIKSMLQCSIVIDKSFNGYIGFDECKKIRNWTQHEIEILMIVSKIIGVFLKRRKADKLILQKNERLSQIVKSIPGGVAIYRLTKDNKVTTDYVSSGLAKMCGYTQNEFLNLLKDDAISNIVKEDRPTVFSAIKTAINGNSNMNVVYRIFKKDKSTLLIRLNANLMKSKSLNSNEVFIVYGVHTVVTDYEQRLIQQQKQNKLILDKLDIAYIGWNINEKPYSSEQFKRYAISKAPLNKILSNTAGEDYVHPDDAAILKKFFDDKNNDDFRTASKMRMKMCDGSYRWTEIFRFSEHDSKGKLISALGIFMDVNEEWIEQNTYLKNALNEVEQAKKSKELFFSQMSHDLRTPLNAVINLSNFAKENINDKEALSEYIDSIYSSGQLLLGLINDGLDLEKAEAGKVILNPTEYSYAQFKKSIITIIEPLCRQKHIQLLLTDTIKHYYIIADKVRFEQIFINLLSNAVKFTPEGGKIEFLCRNKKATENNFECDFVVKDNGIGMSKEFQKEMFIPFAQENNNTNYQSNGTGLGLSIVYKLVHLMNGNISVNSEKGKGTEFIVHLSFPYVKAKSDENDEQADKSFNLENKTILLVEDHSLNAMIATKILEKSGIKVITCENGKIALDVFSSSKLNTFDAILMDVRMPVMDGLTATKMIRTLKRSDAKCVPIIAMSANTFDSDIKSCLDAGMNAHLAKPIDKKTMIKCLSRLLNK